MDYAALAGVVMGNSVIFVCDGFACPVCRRRYCGFPFAPADDFNAQMVDCYGLASFLVVIEYVMVEWYNLTGMRYRRRIKG